MITPINKDNIVTSGDRIQVASYVELIGRSTDTKPTDVANGSVFIEMDTSSFHFFDSETNTWYKFGTEE